MEFFGRDQELKKLGKFYRDPDSMLAIVYGRRRVGKSELIKESLKNTEVTSIYFECRQTSEMNNTEHLARLMGEALGYPTPAFRSFEELMACLFSLAEGKGIVLVLDEYPYLRQQIPGIDSILQVLIDGGHGKSGIKIVLCGSFIGVMQSLLGEGNPLYGRSDLSLHLQPMDYYDSALFYPRFSKEDRVRIYAVLGGIPFYNRYVDDRTGVRDNIMQLISSPGARLESEVSMFLRAELSRVENANEVFEALARGFSRFSDILSQSHVSSSPALAEVLDKLAGMGLVAKEKPINEPDNKRKSRWIITDNLSLFFFRYIFRFASERAVMEENQFFNRFIARDFEDSHVPHVFEDVCRQYLIRRNRLGLMDEPFHRIGKYRFDDPAGRTSNEFDIVTEDDRGYVSYESKFRSSPISLAMVKEEMLQVESSPLPCSRFGFFSRSGYAENVGKLAGVALYTLDDLYD